MISIYRRGRIWWARGTVDSRPIRVSLDTQFKEVAWQRAIDLEKSGSLPVAWGDFRKDFLQWKKLSAAASTQAKYDFVTWRFGKFLHPRGIELLREVTPEVILSYCKERMQDKHPTKQTPMGAPGMKSDLRLLHGAFSYAVDTGKIAKNPVIEKGLNTPPGNTKPFEHAEIEKMLACPYVAQNLTRKALILTFLYTGLRISDVSALRQDAVNFTRDTISVTTQKRKKPVLIALHPILKTALREHLKALASSQRFNPFMFPTVNGKRRPSQTVDAMLRRIFRHAKIERGHAHRFRDTMAVGLLAAGASLYDVSKLLGITMRIAEAHYSPYVEELKQRGARLVNAIDFRV